MSASGMDNLLLRLRQKRATDEVDSRKRMNLIVGAITIVISMVAAWYHNNFMLKDLLHDWDNERCHFLNRLKNGNEVHRLSGTQGFDNMQLNDDNTPTSTRSCKKRSRSSSSFAIPCQKKRARSKDVLATAVDRMTSSLEEYLLASKRKLDAREVYNEVNGVPGLEEEQCLKACIWFMENEKQLEMLKKLPVEKKTNFILMLIR